MKNTEKTYIIYLKFIYITMLKDINSIYLIGIGGVSMSALAMMLKSKGLEVSGSDASLSEITENLTHEGIAVKQGHAPDFVKKSDAVVYSGAISNSNKDLILAKKLDKKIFTRAEILGMFSGEKKTISIAGTHGKTTTTGMIATMLLFAKENPTIHIGGILKEIESNFHVGAGEILLTEACEYQDAFLSLDSFISVVLNIEEDHLDYFKSYDNILNSFNKFIKNTRKNGVIIYNFDNCGEKIDKNFLNKRKAISFGFDPRAELQARNIKSQAGRFSFDVFWFDKKVLNICPSALGRHNIYNALATIAVGLALNIDVEIIKTSLENYKGVNRRMEVIESGLQTIVHDYAHHPQEIEETLKVIKSMTESKLICIFQPHTFSRTQALYESFLSCFGICDEVWFLPIYPAREKPIKNINSRKLCDDLNKKGQKSRFFSSFGAVKEEILKNRSNKITFAILGAGDIEHLANSLKK